MSVYHNAFQNGRGLEADFVANKKLVRYEGIPMYISVGGRGLSDHEKELLARRIAASLNATAGKPLLLLEA